MLLPVSRNVQSLGWTRREFAATFQRMLLDRYREIGREVRRLRENKGWTQERLAQEAGLATKTISRIESPGDEPHEIRPTTYLKLSGALGVSVEHLRAPLFRNAEISQSNSPSPPASDENGQQKGEALPDLDAQPGSIDPETSDEDQSESG